MHATHKNSHDVKKYFGSTFIICPEYDPNKMLFVESVNKQGIYVVDKNGDKGMISLEDGGYVLTSPLALRRQWFNSDVDNQASLISRIPARMWKKGVAAENTQFSVLNSSGNLIGCGFTPSRIHSFMENKDQFPEKFKPASKVQALSPLWAVRVDGTLYLLEYPVGKVSLTREKGNLLKEFKNIPLPQQLKKYEFNYV